MKYLILAALAVAAPVAAAPDRGPVSATLAAPLAASQRFESGVATWSCTGAACTGPASNARLGDARACRELAKAAGAVASFTGTRGDLSADDLARCNRSARAASSS